MMAVVGAADDGVQVGDDDGKTVGADGIILGATVGLEGTVVGCTVGFEGTCEGVDEGLVEGVLLGLVEGWCVGVGLAVGEGEGTRVGEPGPDPSSRYSFWKSTDPKPVTGSQPGAAEKPWLQQTDSVHLLLPDVTSLAKLPL